MVTLSGEVPLFLNNSNLIMKQCQVGQRYYYYLDPLSGISIECG